MVDSVDTTLMSSVSILSTMPGKRGDPKSPYPQIRVSRETYDKLRKLKFKLECDTFEELIEKLIEMAGKL